MTLDMASKKYLNKTKNNKELHLDRAKIGSELGYYENTGNTRNKDMTDRNQFLYPI